MPRIRFQFSPSKLVQAIAYFAWKKVPQLTKLKTAKLLYFADKHHLLAHGRPILGDVYFCMPHGPVPSAPGQKFAVVLNRADVTDPIYLALATSKVELYDTLPQFKNVVIM